LITVSSETETLSVRRLILRNTLYTGH